MKMEKIEKRVIILLFKKESRAVWRIRIVVVLYFRVLLLSKFE